LISIADADFTDNVMDVILVRRVYKGSMDIFVMMVYEVGGGY
jgi:hypothetical protein